MAICPIPSGRLSRLLDYFTVQVWGHFDLNPCLERRCSEARRYCDQVQALSMLHFSEPQRPSIYYTVWLPCIVFCCGFFLMLYIQWGSCWSQLLAFPTFTRSAFFIYSWVAVATSRASVPRGNQKKESPPAAIRKTARLPGLSWKRHHWPQWD